MPPGDGAFEALGILPTANAAEIRRAYFAAVRRHPPHADPAAFRRIRDAYEALSSSGGRAAAFMLAPVDLAAELGALRRRFDAPLADAAAKSRSSGRGHDAVQRFVTEVPRRPWSEARHLGRP